MCMLYNLIPCPWVMVRNIWLRISYFIFFLKWELCLALTHFCQCLCLSHWPWFLCQLTWRPRIWDKSASGSLSVNLISFCTSFWDRHAQVWHFRPWITNMESHFWMKIVKLQQFCKYNQILFSSIYLEEGG